MPGHLKSWYNFFKTLCQPLQLQPINPLSNEEWSLTPWALQCSSLVLWSGHTGLSQPCWQEVSKAQLSLRWKWRVSVIFGMFYTLRPLSGLSWQASWHTVPLWMWEHFQATTQSNASYCSRSTDFVRFVMHTGPLYEPAEISIKINSTINLLIPLHLMKIRGPGSVLY